ncbi:S41 family peptidase [Flavobacterium sp. '19STA2R22 D10 B1']|uniref:S41 family peptidase n=1 Tax=Flavobacterium aerium TaxID=3037261 RepID=UPI00278BD269|nr:S41 family peptidase [Flavobacterium sp. '19STA2R22 D10 B1']
MNKLPLFLLLSSFALFGQNSDKACDLITKINKLIKKEHFKPKPIDDSLSVYVFDSFINTMDSERNIFLKTEYEALTKHRLLLDNYILRKDCSFFEDFVSTYKKALLRTKASIEKIDKEKFDYALKSDTIRFTKDEVAFYVKENDVDRVWRKRLRYDVLEDISKMSTKLDSLKQNFSTFEKASRTKIFETNLCKISSILDSSEGIEEYLHNTFYSIYCSYFDPHTTYFSYDDKSSFFSSLSTDTYSLGLYVSLNENEEIIVDEVVPGGPAAQTNKIDKEDQIIKVTNGLNESYWVSCVAMKTIGDIFFSDTYKNVELTLRKKDGTVYDVQLEKQIMKADQNTVYSFVVEKEARLGYIKIPSFYSDFDGNNATGCADDVAREVIKLQEDKIDGLVIDLQYNGGGSMDEAIKLSGMFIDQGPISFLLNNKNKQTVVNDYNPGSLYNGPIIILINGYTASASEFFAAVMQDYNRAVIMGTTSLGKATMQTVIPLGKVEQDFVKVTIEKFYRVTGKSHQKIGITPDLIVPTLFDTLVSRESSYKTALNNDIIFPKAKFSPYANTIYPPAVERSKVRVENDSLFKEISNVNDRINIVYKAPKAPLVVDFENVFEYTHSSDKIWEDIKVITERVNDVEISNNSYDEKIIANDIFQKEINEFKLKSLRTNPYIEESVRLIKDVDGILKQ